MTINRRWLARGAIAVLAGAAAIAAWFILRPHDLPAGIVSGNGRIEAVEIDIAAKIPGRLTEVLVDEGDYVKAGQVVARIDTAALEAQRAEAEARLKQAVNAIDIANSQLAQRQSERSAALAAVRQRETELRAAGLRLGRSETLAREGATSVQERDDDLARLDSSKAALEAARAQVAASDAAIGTARSQAIGAVANVEAARAAIRRLDADIADSALKAPRDGRVQHRIAQPGEVVGAGGRILNLVDLSDVYMTFFLPEAYAGRVPLGSEVRIVLDAAPSLVIPAKVSFVADVAQFTPKTVETASEREKLMFRVKARAPQELLVRHIHQVKTGLPGMAYVRVQPDAQWPARLTVNAR
ncbi:MAG: HlyD family efflux transporter periplasmic adaptor subunit [Pseudomonadota bacterium]